MRPWRATPSHWGRKKGRELRADPGARTKPGAVSLRLLGCLTSEYGAVAGGFGTRRDIRECGAAMYSLPHSASAVTAARTEADLRAPQRRARTPRAPSPTAARPAPARPAQP